MSQFLSRTRRRLLGAGLTAGAVGAVILAAPLPALAGANIGPWIVMPGGNATLSDQSAAFTGNSVVQLNTSPCPGKLATAGGTGPWNPTVSNRTGTSLTFTVPASGGPAPGPNGAVKLYYACAYDGATAGTSNLLSGGPLYVGAGAAASSNAGLTGGGNPLTLSTGMQNPVFTGYNTVSAVFTTGQCAATLGSTNPANLTVAGLARQSNSTVALTVPSGVVTNGPAPTNYNICLYDGSSAAGSLLSIAGYNANALAVTPGSGSYSASTGVTVSAPGAFLTGITTPAVLVLPMNAGCPGTYSTGQVNGVTPLALTAPGSVRRLTSSRAAVTLPPLTLQQPGQPTTYQICFYSGSTGTSGLIGTTNYTAGVVANPMGINPSAGPPAGGNTITVVGTDFPTDAGRITATLDGVPLTNIQPISDKAFTAQVPAHTADTNLTLVVSTPAGTKALPGAYSYLNTITVSPNTAPSTSPTVDVDVQGAGFVAINFGTGGNAGRVFLVNGVYNGAEVTSGVRANGPVAECVNVLPISDTELVCTLQLNRKLNAQGTGFFDPSAYTNTIASDLSTTAGSRVVVSAAGKFSPNDLGQPIVQGGNANIPPNSLITSVLGPTKVVISAPSPLTGSTLSATIGGAVPAHTFTGSITTTAGSATVSTSSGAFTRADIGRVVSGTSGIANGTTITAVAPGGATATLSAPATASTQYTLSAASTTGGSTTLTSSGLQSSDSGAVIGNNSLGITPGTTVGAVVAGTSATLSAQAAVTAGPADLTLNKPVNANLYAAAPVPDGAYNLVVVSNGAPDAATTDPAYFQTDVTSGSTFTVSPF
ncbi:hypothetical protein ACWT_3777 [Actinoplanes sp. SE50]|uniref:beta strand repeat-containing protein n=1 Tax=unclassified Actinoplanes TaxID=2626549 RepID=UPI00023ECB37|nr:MULTISPECIES: IPT/TIG domain-containing protein [unclassified Actinoplanes]AEV84800.1 hypothetical protein ACPL_3905 [Actinoplanes sp. SE50/110]ATO83192.1 hypothetical protein ACWT_3777 [Actinoplanes sp. SE50]SLM00599.1 hypothetical protein ACSP50_3832 [Actinoplanes sp. SE50/110]